MILTITITLLFAFFRGYSLKNLIKEYTLYPFFIIEIILIIFQICTFCGIYIFVPYASTLKTLFMLSMLLPFFRYKLFKEGLIGSGLIIAGTALNKIVMAVNDGKMPVYPSLSYWTGYTKPEMLTSGVDSIHILGSSSTNLPFLSDYIDVGYSVLSVGDLLIRGFIFLMLYATIKRVCYKRKDLSNNDNNL